MKAKRPSAHQLRLDAILDKYADKEQRPGAERRHVLRLWHEYLYPLRGRLLLALFFAIFLNLQPYFWAYMGNAITCDYIISTGRAIPPAELPLHLRWTIYLFFINSGAHILVIIFTWQNSFQMTYVGQKVVFELRKALHERLQRLPLSFFDGIQTGRLLSVVVDDVETIRNSVANTLQRIVVNLINLLVGAVILLTQNWLMGLVVLAALPCYAYTFHSFRPKIRAGNIAARRATAIMYGRMEERVTGVRTVKVFGRERAEARSFTELVNNLARLMMHLVRMGSWQNVIATTISAVATGFVLLFGMLQVQSGVMTIGHALFFYISAGVVFQPAMVFGDLAVEFQRISVIMRRVFDVLEEDPEPLDRPDAVAVPDARGEIAFQDVTFTYPGDEHPTLNDITVTVPAGKQVAIMGPSGAGKSSLLYLLMRFYDPDSGTISIDGTDLRDTKILSLRDRITLVMQEPVIFSGTVAENIRYGRLDAEMKEVYRAAKDADLHEFIMSLPDGYDTVVGERGMSLSGGQRQRLALAASLLSRPSVLLLDDTTSALDPVTETRVRATLNRLMAGRTCFVVTHRVSTTMASDLVLVLEDGRLTQYGTPTDLLTQDGLFRRVYEQQQNESADK
ncbi:MAG: ABC transporter ATP-binding protein [bacterium]